MLQEWGPGPALVLDLGWTWAHRPWAEWDRKWNCWGKCCLSLSLASKSSQLTAVLKSPGENHFWRNMHVPSGSELFMEKQSTSLKSCKEERANQRTVFSVLLTTLVGNSRVRRWTAEYNHHQQRQTTHWGRSCLSSWGVKHRETEERPPVPKNGLDIPLDTRADRQAKRKEGCCVPSVWLG